MSDRGEAAGDEDDSESILLLIDPVHDHLGHVSRGLVDNETDVLTGVLIFVREDDVLEVAQGGELVLSNQCLRWKLTWHCEDFMVR